MGYIFISYSHNDKDYVHKLYQHLFEHGLDAWIDDRFDYGSNWPYEIERRLKECSVFILVMSPNSYKSEWVLNELELARKLKKPIYTLLLDGEPWWHVQTIKYNDVRNKELPSAKFFVSLTSLISQSNEKDSSISINIGGNVQGNIIVGNGNTAETSIKNTNNVVDNNTGKRIQERVEADRLIREKAEADKKAREKAETDRLTREKAETDKKAREKAETDRLTREKTEADKRAREKAEAGRLVSEKTKSGVWSIYGIILFIFAFVMFILGSQTPAQGAIFNFSVDQASVGTRFVFVVIGVATAFGVYFATKTNSAWEIGAHKVRWMVIGTVLYAFFYFLFNGTVFVVPSLSQVSLRPAIAIPMFFGFAFGPVVGFFTGAVGNMFGDALTGFGLSPQWSIGNGLIGFVSGMWMLFSDKKKSMDTVLYVSGALAVITALLFFMNRTQANMTYFDVENGIFGDAQISLFAGIAILIGFALVFGVRYFFKNEDVATAVTWAMLGNIVGLLFASLSDMVINGFSLPAAIVGEFLPAAGPNLIFAAILVPMLVVAYASTRRQSGR